VHLLGVGVVEATLAELAVEGDDLAVLALHLFDVVVSHRLDVLLLWQAGDRHLLNTTAVNIPSTPGFWIRTDLMRILIQHFFQIADPDPIPNAGFDDQKLTKNFKAVKPF
jgi:hypothetical protein